MQGFTRSRQVTARVGAAVGGWAKAGAIVGLVAIAGCGGGDGRSEIPAGEFLVEVANAACQGDSACLDAWRRDSAGIDLAAASRAGRIAYDAGAAAQCLASLRAADCRTLDMLNTLWPWQLAGVAGCDAMLDPLQSGGAPCASSIECADGGCFVAEGGTALSCNPVRGAGEACPSWEACGNGLYCDASGRCAPQVPAGTSCGTDDQCLGGAECSQSICQPPLSACVAS